MAPQTRCQVYVLAKTGINNIKKGQFILTNICTTSSLADPQMRGSLNVRVPGHRERLCVTAASENSQEDLIVLLGEFIWSYLSLAYSF